MTKCVKHGLYEFHPWENFNWLECCLHCTLRVSKLGGSLQDCLNFPGSIADNLAVTHGGRPSVFGVISFSQHRFIKWIVATYRRQTIS